MTYVIRRTSDNAIVASVVGGAGPTYTASWTPTIVQDYYINAVAVDNGGLSANSASASISVTSPLPVELSDFTLSATFDKIYLNWVTSSEKNNSHFEIERSIDGVEFRKIGKVNGAGNSDQLLLYYFNDENAAEGINYYRLAQVDYDGTKKYSEIKSANNSVATVTAFPNPFSNSTTVILPNLTPVSIELYDSRGKLINTYSFNESTSSFTIGENLRPGIYQLKISSSNFTSNLKLIKL